MKQLIHYIGFCAFLLCMAACEKEDTFSTDTGSVLTFSTDSITFDTVFSTIGSSTKRFMVYNHNGDNLRISDVSFRSGGTNGFRMNLDGQYGTSFTNVEMQKNDSLFCFVEVTVNPHDKDNPVLIDDQIVFTLESGVRQAVTLQAYGQDIIILQNHKVTEDETFTANRPYLIRGALTIDTLATLTINPGTIVCFHADGFIDCNGTIHADGKEEPITFRGDRTDKMFSYLPYDRLDNQWRGIRLNPTSHNNYFYNVDIHSGNFGIIATDTATTETKLEMYNSVIHNVGGDGIFLTNSLATIANTQISNTRGDCVKVFGGKSRFLFCTIAQFCPWIAERGHAFVFYNAYQSNQDQTTYYVPLEMLDVTNCFITGYANDEVYGTPLEPSEKLQQPVFNFKFTNCVLTTEETPDYQTLFPNCTYTEEGAENKSNFHTIDTDHYYYDFRLAESSIARGKGANVDNILKTYPTDRLGVQRNPESIDVGCYQFQ
ncbi:MAG: hypothetical protein IJT97_04595 [Bacteroidaceae bacterium]|nr:hypothetical protein [Bacteroidaceae bacterium]